MARLREADGRDSSKENILGLARDVQEAQRLRWFKKGYDTGDIRQGDTFGASSL